MDLLERHDPDLFHAIRGETARQKFGLEMIASENYTSRAVMAALFGLGRLQPLIDDPQVENIEVDGHDQVWVSYADGRDVPMPPVAESDTELIEILQLLADGMSNVDVAQKLFISQETVKSHVRHILAKLEADTRTQAVAIALREAMID